VWVTLFLLLPECRTLEVASIQLTTPMKLLIVEDNPGVRKVIRNLVASVADEICECADGAGGLALFRQERPHFVLMDIQMDGMDGITATRQVKTIDPTARVIIVTDYDQPDLREAAYQAGACGYVSKENLLELVRLLDKFDKGGKLTEK
jgi:DNA-binding NarL/FixJ family response regulator